MFLDFGLAIFITILFEMHFGTGIFPLLYWVLLFPVLLDADFLFHKFFKPRSDFAYTHRDILHYPLLVLPLGFLSIYFFSHTLAYLFITTVFLHFLHDSIMYGRGIKWLYPFSKNSYAFFYLYSGSKKYGLWQWIFVFNEKNLSQWDTEHADENWVQNIYYKFHPIALIEYGIFLAALICLYLYIK